MIDQILGGHRALGGREPIIMSSPSATPAYSGLRLCRINFGYTQAERWRERPQRARVEIMSPSDELLTLSSVEMRRRIGTKEISPVELVEASIARIEALNLAVNAIAATDFAHARKLAIGAESAARKGEQLGPLHGLPTGIKDLHETAGLLTTYGSPLYRSHVPHTMQPWSRLYARRAQSFSARP